MDMGNFEIEHAFCVDEAFKKLSTGRYDVVVSDYEMPQKDGLQFLKELHEQNNEIPFILFTGKGREEVAIRALNLGADGYYNKQGSPETVYGELSHSINLVVDRRKAKHALRESEARHRAISDVIGDVAFSCLRLEGENFAIDWITGATEKVFGFSVEEIKKRGCWKFAVDPRDLPIFEEKVAGLSPGESSTCELRIIPADGSTRWIRVFSRVENDRTTPKSHRLFGACEDITERRNAKLTLMESEEKFRTLAEESPNMIFINQRGRVVYANKKCMEVMGYGREEFYSADFNFLSLTSPESVETLKSAYAKHLRGETVPPYEYVLITRDGKRINAIINSGLIEYNGDKAVMGIVTDITERKKTEQALSESEEKYRKLFEESMDAIFVADIETGIIVDCNLAASKLVGRQKSALVGQHQSIFTPKEQMEAGFAKVFKQHIKDQTDTLETQIIRKTGEIRDIAVRDTIIELKGKKLMQGTMSDITELKKMKKEVAAEQALMQEVVNSSDALIFSVDRNYHYTSFNDAHSLVMKTIYGADIQIGKSILDYMSVAIDREKTKQNIDKVLAGEHFIEEAFSGDDKLSRKYFMVSRSPIRTVKGEVVGIVVVSNDISQRKKAEEEFKKRAVLIDLSPDAIIVKKLDETITFWSTGAEKLYGYTKQEAIGQKINILLKAKHSQSSARAEVITQLKKGKNWTGEITNYTKNNNKVTVQSYWSATLNAQGDIVEILESNVDITQSKRTEEVLHESQEKFKALFSANPDAAVFLDTGFHVVEANSRFTKLFGYSLDEIKGEIITDIIVPDDSKEESRNIRQKIISDSVEIVTLRRRKDGSQIPLFMSGGPVFVNGKAIGSIMVYKDISDIITVQEELSKALNKAELLNEKLRVVGSLTRHDVRNKLSAVTGYAYILKKKHSDQGDIVDGLSKMEQTVKETFKIFDFAKMYEQMGVEELTYINVEEKLKEATALFSVPTPTIMNECHGLTVLADSFLRQLFFNLIDNTRKYGKKTTTIRVYFERMDQDSLKLVYEDDGVGVSSENKLCLFHEGFSTGGSTGFGLFLAKKMMDVYGWQIQENGTPGEGAKFTITIPKLNNNGKENYKIA